MRFDHVLPLIFFNSVMYASCPAPGTGVVVNGTTTTESGCTITTAGTPGLQANLGGTINFSDGSVTTTGAGAYGAYANGVGSTINLNNLSLQTASANALFLNSGQIYFDTGSILTTGASTNGAQLLGTGSLLNLDTVNVQVNGTSGVGLLVQLGGHTASASNCTISTTAAGGVGVDVGLGSGAVSSASLTNCMINTTASTSFGAVVARNGSSISVQDSTINSSTYGVHSIASGASITVDNSAINVNASSAAFGAYAQNNTTITLQNNTQVITAGASNTHGFVIQDGSTGNILDSSLQTSGTNAQGIFMIGFSSGNQVNLSHSTVSTSGVGASALTTLANTGITNTIQAGDATFSATNSDVISIEGGIANIDFNDVAALASGSHLLALVDGFNPATLNWTSNASYLSGDMQVITGNTGNVTLDTATIWTGAALDVTNLTVTSSDWNLTANSTITNQLIHAGLIDFVSEANVFKTLSVGGPYLGQSGTIKLNTLLESDGSPSDVLIMNGGAATGNTSLIIKNTTGEGALTVGNGILVVEAINGGTTAVDSFSLGDHVIAGPYEYTLFRGSVDSSGLQNWYLRSTQIGPQPDPNYRSDVSLYTALPSMTLLYGRTLLDTLHQRVGEEEQLRCRPCSCTGPLFNGFWIRALNQGGSQNNGGIFQDGPNFNYQFWAVQMGVDVYRQEHCNGSRDHLGVLGAIGSSSGSVQHFNDSNAGQDQFNAYTSGVYWTHFGPSGWYLDGVFETNWYRDIIAKSPFGSRLNTHGVEVAGSLEGGYPLRWKYCILEPQAQLVYQTISLHDTEDIASTVDFNRTNSTAGRLGLRLANTWSIGYLPSGQLRLLTAWLRPSFWHDFQGNSRTFFSSEDGPIGFESDLGGTWFQGDLGLTAQLTDTLVFYGSFGGNVYLNGHGQAYTAIAGIRANF